jgi:undecaprenyl-diphosphatase
VSTDARLTNRRRGFAWWRWRRVRLPGATVLLETAVVGLAVAFFLVLGREYGAAPLVAFDQAGLAIAAGLHSPLGDSLVIPLTSLGSEALWFIWLPIGALLAVLRRLPSAAAILVVALGVHGWNNVLKLIYQRARPNELEGVLGAQSYSFPSGHAMAAGAVYAILAFIAWRELGPHVRWPIVGLCVILALSVALSRVYLGVHYPTDVLAGLLAGVLWADLVVLGWRLAARFTRTAAPQGGAPARAGPS